MGDIPALKCSVTYLCRMYGTPHLMLADSLYEKLGNGIESKLRRFCDKYVTSSHQQIGTVDCLEYILMPESVDTGDIH